MVEKEKLREPAGQPRSRKDKTHETQPEDERCSTDYVLAVCLMHSPAHPGIAEQSLNSLYPWFCVAAYFCVIRQNLVNQLDFLPLHFLCKRQQRLSCDELRHDNGTLPLQFGQFFPFPGLGGLGHVSGKIGN